MVKQYIGARYVPVFDGEYNPEKAYEPLTIVTYLNNSYTSKKFVAAGVLPSNTEFWALTGNYNAQVEEYRQEVVELSNEVDSLSSDITNLTDEVDSLIPHDVNKNRKYVFIGDSYNTTVEGSTVAWAPRVVYYLGLTEDQYYNSGVSGAGFLAGTTFLSQLQGLNISDPNSITDIVVCGGINDVSRYTVNELYAAINTFLTYCKTHFPNAIVSMGWISRINNDDVSTTFKIRSFIEIWESTCASNKRNITNSAYFFSNQANQYANKHPNQNGANAIASGIATFLLGGVKHTYLSTVTQLSGSDLAFTGSPLLLFNEFLSDNVLTMQLVLPSQTLEFDAHNIIHGGSIQLANNLPNYLSNFETPYLIGNGTCLIFVGTDRYNCGYAIRYRDNRLIIRFTTPNGDTIWNATKVIFDNETMNVSCESLIAQ